MMTPEPIPIVKPTACMMAMTENTTPTAPAALVPSLDTNQVSAMLYIDETSIDMIVGMARDTTSFDTGVSVIFL